MPKLVLASSSPYRHQLLKKLQLQFDSRSPNIDESPLANETPQELVTRLAIQKAQTVVQQLKKEHKSAPLHKLVIASDQVACLGDKVLTKPGNHNNAVAQLTLCSGKTVTFYTSLVLLNTQNSNLQQCIEPFNVHFRNLLSPESTNSPIPHTNFIENYLQQEQPYDCAGSFKAEGLGISLFEKLEGDDPNSLVGLPLIKLIRFLEKEGIDIYSQTPSVM